MGTVITDGKVDFKSAQDLLKNNAEDGAWKGQFRDKFEERSDQIEQMQAGLNEQAALDNILAAQQAQITRYIIDPISGEVVETSDGFDSGLSVGAITNLIERGASDDEIAAALDEAIATISGRIASDKKNAKKYLAHLQELLSVLELSLKQAGKSIELQNTLRQLQEKTSKLIQSGDVAKIQEFLRSSQLRQALTQSVQQSRQQVEFMRQARDMMRNLATQVKESGMSSENALKTLQQTSRDMLQAQMRQLMSQLKDTHTKLSSELSKATDPALQEALRQSLKENARRAQELQKLSKQTDPNITSKQFEQTMLAMQRMRQQTIDSVQALRLSQGTQVGITSSLVATQAAMMEQLNAQLQSQKAGENKFNSGTLASQQDALLNLQAQRSLLTRDSLQQQGRAGQDPSQIGAKASEREAVHRSAIESKNAVDSKNPEVAKEAQRQSQEQAKIADKEASRIEKQETKIEKQEAKKEAKLEKQEAKKAETVAKTKEDEAAKKAEAIARANEEREAQRRKPEQETRPKPTGELSSCNSKCPCGVCGSNISFMKEIAQQTGAASIGAQSLADSGGNLSAALNLTSVPPATPSNNPNITGQANIAAQPVNDFGI